jgi:hypothetical protein
LGSIQTFSGGIFSGSGWGRVCVGVYVGGSFHEGSFHGGKDIALKGVPDFPALFKKKD